MCVSISGLESWQATKWSDIREKHLTNKQLHERLDNIESFDEIYNHRCLNWFVKLAIMPATESVNHLPQKLLGAWCYTGNRLRGRPLENTRHSYLDLLNNLKFDESDPILGSNHGELSCIFALMNGCWDIEVYGLNGLPRALLCVLIWKARSSVDNNVMVLVKLDGRDVSRIVDLCDPSVV